MEGFLRHCEGQSFADLCADAGTAPGYGEDETSKTTKKKKTKKK